MTVTGAHAPSSIRDDYLREGGVRLRVWHGVRWAVVVRCVISGETLTVHRSSASASMWARVMEGVLRRCCRRAVGSPGRACRGTALTAGDFAECLAADAGARRVGNAHAAVSCGGNSVKLSSRGDSLVCRGLVVAHTRGVVPGSGPHLPGADLGLRVEDRHARFRSRVAPLVQQAKGMRDTGGGS